MHGVGHGLFLVGLYWHAELDGLGISFLEVIGLGGDCPVVPTIKMFDYAYFHRFFLRLRSLISKVSSIHLSPESTRKFVCLRSPTRSKEFPVVTRMVSLRGVWSMVFSPVNSIWPSSLRR